MPHGSTARDPSPDRFELSLVNQQTAFAVDEPRLLNGARRVLADSRYRSAAVSLAVVDDATIRELNRRHLAHDWPTDVLSFELDERGGHLEAEVVLSAQTAAAIATEGGWTEAEEQLLYVIHGTLHLVGCSDTLEAHARVMRAAECHYLCQMGIDASRARHIVSYRRGAEDSAIASQGSGAP